MVVYSFSQINLYEQCPKKYQYRYLDWLEREFETSPDLILGTSVHWALEWLYQQINIYKTPIKADLLWKFHDLWNNSIAEAWEKLIYKGEQHEEDYLRRWQHYLEEYYTKYVPFDWVKVVATELMLNFSLDKNEYSENKQFRWVIDRLDKDDEWNFIINDYKTNKNLPPEDKDEYREQLTLYAHGIQQKYGKYLKSIKARLHYLHFNLLDEWEVTQDSIDNVVAKYSGDIDKIEHSRFEYNMGFQSAFPTKQNPYCKYCEYQNVCPLWQHINYEDEVISWWDLGEKTIKNLIDQYVKLGKNISEQDKEREMIKWLLIEYAEKKGFEQLFWNESKIWISKTENYSVKDKEQFLSFLKEHNLLNDVIDVPFYKVNALVKGNKLSEDEVKTYLEKKDSWRLTGSKK